MKGILYYVCLVILTLLPSALIMFFVLRKDTNKKSKKVIALFFIAGVLSVFYLNAWFNDLFEALCESMLMYNNNPTINLISENYIIAGLTEEMTKFTLLFALTRKRIKHTYDAVVYSVLIGLGFATIENIFYVVCDPEMGVAIARMFLCIPGHFTYAVIMGYFYGIVKKHTTKYKKAMPLLLSVIVPVGLHGTYDYLINCENLFNGAFLLWVFALLTYVVVVKYIVSWRLLSHIAKNNERISKIEVISFVDFNQHYWLQNNY